LGRRRESARWKMYSPQENGIVIWTGRVARISSRAERSSLRLVPVPFRAHLRPEKSAQVLQLPRRDLPVAARFLEQPGGHFPGRRVLVLQEITNFSFVLPGCFHVAATGQQITDIDGYRAGCSSAFRDRCYLVYDGAGARPGRPQNRTVTVPSNIIETGILPAGTVK